MTDCHIKRVLYPSDSKAANELSITPFYSSHSSGLLQGITLKIGSKIIQRIKPASPSKPTISIGSSSSESPRNFSSAINPIAPNNYPS
jgi:hypothetical protein